MRINNNIRIIFPILLGSRSFNYKYNYDLEVSIKEVEAYIIKMIKTSKL